MSFLLTETFEGYLDQVEKPARYIGLEEGAQKPSHAKTNVAWLLTYPDVYEVGLPYSAHYLAFPVPYSTPQRAL